MNRVFKTRQFARWMRKTTLTNDILCQAVSEMQQGLIDANLGQVAPDFPGRLIKKRVALPGRGKRGGSRVLLGTNKNDRWFFMHGFKKTDTENITSKEEEALKALALDLLNYSADNLDIACQEGILEEICHDEKYTD